MRSSARRGLTPWLIPALLALSTAACVGSPGAPPTQFAGLTLDIKEKLREPCQHPPLPSKVADAGGVYTTTVGALEAFGNAADVQLEICAQRHAAVLDIIDLHNQFVTRASEQIATSHKPWFLRWKR